MNTSFLLVGIALPWLMVALFVGLGCWVGFQLIHQNGRLLSRLEAFEHRLEQMSLSAAQAPSLSPAPAAPPPSPAGLPLGSPAPAFELPDLNGGRQSLADFRGQRLLLMFFNPGCGFCTRMAADLATWPTHGEDGHPLPLVLTTGDREENRQLVEAHGIRCPVLLQQGMEIASQYQANGTPMGYLIDEQGRIASALAIGSPALLELVNAPSAAGDARGDGNGGGPLGGKRSVEDSRLERHGLPAGTPAPAFRLPLLHGGELALDEYRGRRVLLVFSDPNCGPCDQLSPALEQVARRTPGVQVLMVSRGEAEANRAKAAQHGLTFPIVLQRQWEISKEYAMFATPIAYLIDAEGLIARDVAVGVEPILGLLTEPAQSLPFPTNGKGKVPHRTKEAAARRR